MEGIKFCLVSILLSPLILNAQTNSTINVASASDNFSTFSIGQIYVVPVNNLKNETPVYQKYLKDDQLTNLNEAIKSSSDIKFFVYPNPVCDFITISSLVNYTLLSCTVFDSKNVVVLNPSPPFDKINFSSLKAGKYVIRVIYNKGVLSYPIVKM